MAQYPSKVQRLRMIQETTFGVEAALGSFLTVPFREGSLVFRPIQPVESPTHARQYMDGRAEGVLMPRAAELEFDVNLEALTTKATSTVAPANGWLGQMLEAAFGGKSLSTGTTVAGAGATTTVIPLTTHTTIHPGCALGFATGAGGLMECREVKSKSGADHTLKHALTAAPGNLTTAYGSASYFPDPYMDGSDAKSLQFFVEGMQPTDRWLAMGGGLDSMSFMLSPPDGIPKVKFKWKFAKYLRADAVGAPFGTTTIDTSGDALGLSTYTNVNTLVIKDSEFRQQTNGTSTIGPLIHAPTIEYRPNVVWAAHRTPTGIETVKQWVRTHAPPLITGSFTLPYEDETWQTAHETLLNKMFAYQIGSSTTVGAALLSAPTCQVTDVQPVDIDGIAGVRVDWEGRNDEDVTAESTFESVAHAAFRLHIF